MPTKSSTPLAQRSHLTMPTLPADVLLRIFRYVGLVELACISRVSKAWHAAATDNRLWEGCYWLFFRPIVAEGNDDELSAKQAREVERQAAMLSWLRESKTSLPASELFEIHSKKVWQALTELGKLAKLDAPPPNVSPQEFGSMLTAGAKELKEAERAPAPMEVLEDYSVPTPHFLEDPATPTSDVDRPNFYRLFAKRIKADQAFLQELRAHLDLQTGTLRSLMDLIAKHGSVSRQLLAALGASQRITAESVKVFLPDKAVREEGSWPQALHIHFIAAQRKALPQRHYCLALQHTAFKALGHLQRQEAVASIRELQQRRSSFERSAWSSAKEHITSCCVGVEEALTAVSLFRGAERIQVAEYLDLLALFVWADLQAEDRQAELRGTVEHTMSYPPQSTRHRLARIVSSLDKLGYCAASDSVLKDVDNAFINVVLFCPGQRETAPIILAAIVAAIARRLGIAAAVTDTEDPVLLVALEDSSEPEGRRQEHSSSEWQRFYVNVAEGGSCCVWEQEAAQAATSEISTSNGCPLEPASPLKTLERVARYIFKCTEESRYSIMRYGGGERYLDEDRVIYEAAAGQHISRLRLYLEGRHPSPPLSLPSATLAPSLCGLPPIRMHDVAKKSPHTDQDAQYCAHWISRLVAPQLVGGIDQANDILGRAIASTTSGYYACDYVLLLQCDRSYKGKAASEGLNALQGFKSSNGSTAPPAYFTEHIMKLFDDDEKRGLGLGCAGGRDPRPRQHFSGLSLPRRQVDRAFPSNAQVNHGIGTVFTHAQEGWRGVVVGWDTECRSCEHWISQHNIDSDPSGGRHQPFYQVITEENHELYIPQCHVKPVIVPAGSTPQQASEILKKLTRLLTVRTFGKAFRTLRVAPWDEKEQDKVAMSKSKAKKEQRKAEKKRKTAREPEKGQVYLVTNAWMKEAWPYD